MEIVWTQMARITYFEILESLLKYWTSKEIQNFHRLTEENILQINSGKILHPLIDTKSEIRKVVLHPNVALFYKIKEDENRLFLITFFNNRMNPQLLKKLLNI